MLLLYVCGLLHCTEHHGKLHFNMGAALFGTLSSLLYKGSNKQQENAYLVWVLKQMLSTSTVYLTV